MSGGDTDYSASQNPPSPYASSTGDNYSSSQPAGGPYGEASSGLMSGGYAPYSAAQPADLTSSSAPAMSRLVFGNGVNMQPSYQESGNVDLGWHLVDTIPSIKTVRLEIESLAVDAAVRWISEANAHGYTVIATYHDKDALNENNPPEDDAKYMQQAIQFWNSNYKKLRAAGPFMINIMNEWGHKALGPRPDGAKIYADQYNDAIRAIRTYYQTDWLIIDLPGYGQLAKVAADAVTGSGGISPIQDQKVILSMHVYPEAVYPEAVNVDRPLRLEDVDLLVATGRPCMIGEFGESNKTPRTDWRAMVTYAKSLNWPVLAWCWDGDGDAMNIMSPEFLKFVPGQPNPNYYINPKYADIVLPFLS